MECGQDRLIAEDDIARATEAAGRARVEVWELPEAGHGKAWLEAPDAYRQHLARFLSALGH